MRQWNYTFIFWLILILLPWANAQSFDASSFLDNAFAENGDLVPEVQSQLSFASQQFQTLPDPVKAIFGNQRVELILARNSGKIETFGVVLNENQIVSFTRRAPENPSMQIETSEATMMNIAQSENISNAFIEAVNAGTLTYSAVEGGGGEFAVFMANIATWIMTVINAFLGIVGMK
jgi:hypothetical protein